MTEHTSPPPDVSIVIPCFNYAEYVAQAIESAVSQTHPSVEVIIVDDGSTDNSPQIIATYAADYPERVRVITQVNQGVAKALDAGVREAQGRYVLPLGSDDYFHPETVAIMLRYAQAHPEYAVVYPNYCRIRATGELELISPVSTRALKVEGDILPSVLGAGIVVASALILKEAIHRVGGFFLNGVWRPEYRHEDYFMYLRLMLLGYQFGHVREPLLYYRDTPNSRGKDVRLAALGKHTALQYAYRHYPHRMVDAANELLSLGLAQRQEAQELRSQMDAQLSAACEQMTREFEEQYRDLQARHADQLRTQQVQSARKDVEVSQLQAMVSELQSELERSRSDLSRVRVLREKFESVLAQAKEEAASVASRNEQLREQLVSAEASTRVMRSDLERAHLEIHKMRSTRGWRAIEKWWATRDSVRFRVRRVRQLATMSRSVLMHAGPRAFADRLVRWLRGERRYFRPNVGIDSQPSIPSATGVRTEPQNIARPARAGRPRSLKVAYIVSGGEHLHSTRYRVRNVQEQLRKLGVTLSDVLDIDVGGHRDLILGFDVVVFSRVVALPGFEELISELEGAGIPTVFEIDDYVFDPQIVEYVDAIRHLPKPDLELYIDGVRRYRAMLMRCEYFIGSTQYLADRASAMGRKSYVIRNGLNDRQLELAEAALLNRRATGDSVRIGYLSGTATHRADFNVAVPALARILNEYPNVRLVIRGFLDVPEGLSTFAERIDLCPFVPWEDLVAATAELDINLAPLEHNPFTEAKSALKYFEAGLVEVPTVATPTDDFRYAIRHGENGMLAETDEGWYVCLRALVLDADLRRHIGQAARRDVLQRYTSAAQGPDALRVFSSVLFDSHFPLPLTPGRGVATIDSITQTGNGPC